MDIGHYLSSQMVEGESTLTNEQIMPLRISTDAWLGASCFVRRQGVGAWNEKVEEQSASHNMTEPGMSVPGMVVTGQEEPVSNKVPVNSSW